jgi:hypothetical protein
MGTSDEEVGAAGDDSETGTYGEEIGTSGEEIGTPGTTGCESEAEG